MIQREPSGRKFDQIRPVTIEGNVNRYAEGSVLICSGNTHVLCTASIEEKVPPWLAGKGKGWITAEYSMLPRATHTRNKREREKVTGRTQEIQRLISRALRSMVDLKKLGERTIVVDCDVLQADGGTRTTSITGGCVALAIALEKLIREKKIAVGTIVDSISAVSVGIRGEDVLVDLDYSEDSTCDVDMNFVMTGNGNFIEVQGTGEQKAFSKKDLYTMMDLASHALADIRDIQHQALKNFGIVV